MLILKNIVKEYTAGDTTIKALKNINIDFRQHEFVSIVGPPGCGKTTLLNIIGGLDVYTSGNISINGKSTKEFTERDWDSFHNSYIGFVLKGFNLLPNETVLNNVELTLSLSGIPKQESREIAIATLKGVSLNDKLNKKFNKMSYDEIQRAKVARALVNNPDILLADEPTADLNSETALQLMELLKEASKDKLIIVVTNNLELAEKYSTRTIKLADGNIIDDSNPYHVVVEKPSKQKNIERKKNKKISISLLTSLRLSLSSFRAHKSNSTIASFIGSFGLLGIALILTVLSKQPYVKESKLLLAAFAVILFVISFFAIGSNIYSSTHSLSNEIGILRSLGATKVDIFCIFIAEAFLISFASNVIVMVLLLILSINNNIKKFIGISAVTEYTAILTSLTFSLIAGLISSIIAARKSPVALLKTN